MRELKAARHFHGIFEHRRWDTWDSILKVLERRQRRCEVRVMYGDGMCLMLLPYHPRMQGAEKKESAAKCFRFIKPTLSTYQNNRDHRRLYMVDGHTAFTGGVIWRTSVNRKVRFGLKDTAIMLKGDAVQSFTMMFCRCGMTESSWRITGSTRSPKL